MEPINKLFSLQEERVIVYKEFLRSFKEYLSEIRLDHNVNNDENINFIQFRFICKLISEKFNIISNQILEIKNKLSNDSNLFKLVEKLQQFEEKKFKLVSLNSIYFKFKQMIYKCRNFAYMCSLFIGAMDTFENNEYYYYKEF